MDAELKTNTKISYIRAYIEEKFPMYINIMSHTELFRLVNSIQRSSIIRDLFLEEVKNGRANKFIEQTMLEYAKTYLKDTYDNFDNLTVYISNFLQKKFNDNLLLLNELSYEIALEVQENDNYGTLMSNVYNNIYIDKYLKKRDKMRNLFYTYVKGVIGNTGFDDITSNEIFNEIALEMLSKYGTDYDDDSIRIAFTEKYKEYTNKIIERVKFVLNRLDAFDVMFVSEKKIVSDMVIMATVRGEISGSKIIHGNMDEFIINYAKMNKNEKVWYDDSQVLNHIFNVLINESDKDIIGSVLRNFASEVMETLMGPEYRFTRDNIMDCECDDLIRKMYNDRYHSSYINVNVEQNKMRTQSVSNSIKADLIKYSKRKKRIHQSIAKLLTVAILTTSCGFGLNYLIDRREDSKLIELAKSLDRTREYSIRHYNTESERYDYEKAVSGIISYYNKLFPYGNEYRHLCFYNAYKSEGMYILDMDEILLRVKAEIKDIKGFEEFESMIKDDDCYYDFIYDSLVQMGCKEIFNEKYLNAIVSYKQSYYGNSYGIVSDHHIYSGDEAALEEMEKLYRKYCEDYQIQLGELLMNVNNETLSTGSKRGV